MQLKTLISLTRRNICSDLMFSWSINWLITEGMSRFHHSRWTANTYIIQAGCVCIPEFAQFQCNWRISSNDWQQPRCSVSHRLIFLLHKLQQQLQTIRFNKLSAQNTTLMSVSVYTAKQLCHCFSTVCVPKERIVPTNLHPPQCHNSDNTLTCWFKRQFLSRGNITQLCVVPCSKEIILKRWYRGVGSNSIQCTSCHKWVHKKCSSIKGSIYKVMRSRFTNVSLTSTTVYYDFLRFTYEQSRLNSHDSIRFKATLVYREPDNYSKSLTF